MLGFSSLSETALSQAVLELASLGYLDAAVASTNTGILAYQALANVTPPAAISSVLANPFGDVDAQATTSVVSAFSSFNINDLLDIYAQATIAPSAAVATFSADTLSYDAEANLTLGSVTSNILAYNLADVDAQANTTLSSTSAYLTIYITDFADEDAQARAFMSPAVATTNVAVEYDAKGNTGVSNVFATTDISSVDFDAKANITTSSILLTGVTEDPAYIWGNSRVYPTSVLGKFKLKLGTPLDNSFPYANYADAYSPQRVLYIIENSGPGTETVYVEAENFTVTIDPIVTSATDTVFIAQENFTVFIPPYTNSSTTIFIDR